MNIELPVALVGKRDQLRMFALKAKSEVGDKTVWTEMPFQLDPVDNVGRFIFFKDESWRKDKIELHDRMIFNTSGFGRRKKYGEAAPCAGRTVYQYQDKESPLNYAYLALCDGDRGPSAPEEKTNDSAPAVAYLKDKRTLSTSQYTYVFSQRNQMLFERISIGDGPANTQLIAEDSDLLIKSDVKNFFTMRFDSSQIESYLEETRPGLIGTLARVSFYLKILFFKIKLSLTTDVTFYHDVGHIPMVVQLPVDAKKYLHPKSGILYSWKLSPEVSMNSDKLRMPTLDPAVTGKGYEELSKIGLRNCSGEYCAFGFAASVGDKALAMEFEIPIYMVKAGFFPQLVSDIGAFDEQMGWNLRQDKKEAPRMGLYFEVSGLPEGGHPWDFWLRLGSSESLHGSCPRGLNITRL